MCHSTEQSGVMIIKAKLMDFAFLANLVFIVSWLYFCIYTQH